MGTIVCYLYKMTVEKTLAIQLSFISNRLLAIYSKNLGLGYLCLWLTKSCYCIKWQLCTRVHVTLVIITATTLSTIRIHQWKAIICYWNCKSNEEYLTDIVTYLKPKHTKRWITITITVGSKKITSIMKISSPTVWL